MRFDQMSPEVRKELQSKGGKSRSMSKVWWAKRNGNKPCREGFRRGRPRKPVEETQDETDVFAG
jgi:hypothetical protein